MRRSNYPLRLQPSLMEQARKVAESEGVALNQLFNVAVAEKLATLRAEKRFPERIRRAARPETLQILDRTGIQNRPMESEELPIAGLQAQPAPLIGEVQVQPAPPPNSPLPAESTEETGEPFGIATPLFGKLKRRLERIRGR